MVVTKLKLAEIIPDPQQKLALEHVTGPMLVIAGAGTGKTTVLTQRFARLVDQGHAKTEEILALTYTLNSAAEMKKRVQLASAAARNAQAYTFHDYCFDMLKRHGHGFDVIDDCDLNILLRKRIRDLNLKYFVRAAKVGQFLKDLLEFMRRCQDELVTASHYRAYVGQLERGEAAIHRIAKSRDVEDILPEDALGRCQEIAGVFEVVEKWLADEKIGTFGHMITRALALLEANQEILKSERARARFILADEFQDVNFAQIRLLTLLAGNEANLFAVGDPDQAIYRFRGASSGAFDIFLRQFPATRIVRLERNRRSLSPILQCAHAIIKTNPPIFGQAALPGSANLRYPLVSVREEESAGSWPRMNAEPVEIIAAKKDREAQDLVMAIRTRKRLPGVRWRDFAVLYRSHAHREEVVEELSLAGVSFAVETMDVLDTPQVRDLLACVGAIVDPTDSISLFRVSALREFVVDPLSLQAVMRSASRDTDLRHILDQVEGGPAVLAKLEHVRAELSQKKATGLQAVRIILQRFNLERENLATQAFVEFVGGWERKTPPIRETGELGELLEYLKLFREVDGKVPAKPPEQPDAVQVMSAHTAKGLEFCHVFVIRLGSNSFPASYRESLVEFPQELRDPQSIAPRDSKELNAEEERRLFYVAMTRAKDTLTLYARPGVGKKDPTPPGYARDLLTDKNLHAWRRGREPEPVQIDLLASAEQFNFASSSPSPVSGWIALPLPIPAHRGLSASAIETYERCPLQFKLNRDWRIPEESRAALQNGSAMHLALRHYYDAIRFERHTTVAEVVAIFRNEFAKAVIPDSYQRELYERQGVRQLEDFIAAAENNVPSVLHTEQEFRVDLAGSAIRGRIDRIDRLADGSVRIVDYKTGKAKTQDDADESLQLSIYALAAREKWGYHASLLALHNLEDGSVPVTSRDEPKLRKELDRIQQVAVALSEGKFDPKPGRHCSWCGFRNLCPATEKRLAVLQIPIADQN